MEKPKLIEDLGYLYPKETSKKKKRYGLYKCPICKENYKALVNNVNTGNSTKCMYCSRITRSYAHSAETATTRGRVRVILAKNNKSGYKGVFFRNSAQKFGECISVNKHSIHLGYFLNAFDAAVAYDTYVIKNNLEHTINGVL